MKPVAVLFLANRFFFFYLWLLHSVGHFLVSSTSAFPETFLWEEAGRGDVSTLTSNTKRKFVTCLSRNPSWIVEFKYAVIYMLSPLFKWENNSRNFLWFLRVSPEGAGRGKEEAESPLGLIHMEPTNQNTLASTSSSIIAPLLRLGAPESGHTSPGHTLADRWTLPGSRPH